MTQQEVTRRFSTVGDGSGLVSGDSFSREEVQLALRNRGMPLEVLRYSITPVGLHYLLVHFGIPFVEVQDWNLSFGGLLSQPLSLSLDEIRAKPARTLAVTMECAGNGRALLSPRSISQPWLLEAVSTAEWTGHPLETLITGGWAARRGDGDSLHRSGSGCAGRGGSVLPAQPEHCRRHSG